MTNRKIFIGLALILILTLSLTTFTRINHGYYVNVFVSEGGWGYDILYKNKIIIHQPYIPALNGKYPFQNVDTARETGCLVIKKLIASKSPAIGKAEINNIINGTK
jgi:hypothetical protein